MTGTDLTITGCLKEISTRLTDAAAVAKAAVTCAENGSEAEAVRISMDLDELLHEASTLHGAVALLHRLPRRGSQERGGPPG
jgi:hypothetical protein